MIFSNGVKEYSKMELLKLARFGALSVAIVSVLAPIYRLKIDLPSFDSLSKFSGSIQQLEYIGNKNSSYELTVVNGGVKYVFRLPDVNVHNRLVKQLTAGYITVWYKRDLMLKLNVYQINKNSKNIVDYNTLVNKRNATAQASLNLSYIWFPVGILISFFAHLGVRIENNKV